MTLHSGIVQQMLKDAEMDFYICTLICHMAGPTMSSVITTHSILKSPLQQSQLSHFLIDHFFLSQIIPYCLQYVRSSHFHYPGKWCPWSQTIHPLITTNICMSLTVNPLNEVVAWPRNTCDFQQLSVCFFLCPWYSQFSTSSLCFYVHDILNIPHILFPQFSKHPIYHNYLIDI